MKKIGVLTSGGDAPGMNAAIRAVVRTAIAHGVEVYGVHDGYYGLYHNNIVKLEKNDVSGIINQGGTFLRSARFVEFKDPEIRKVAIENLNKLGIEGLIVIGGDGSYMGASKLSEMGLPCIALPGTIDNDAPMTQFTIGFDTALNTVKDAIDKLRDTSNSHKRCSVVEVMGRNAGDLALYAGIATGSEFVIVPEFDYNIDDIIDKMNADKSAGRTHYIIIVAEGVKIVPELTKLIEEKTGVETRATILGHIQRGGSPSAVDRVLASSMASFATIKLLNGEKDKCIGIINNELVANDIMAAIETEHVLDEAKYILANTYLNI